jgi:hypothetical protein
MFPGYHFSSITNGVHSVTWTSPEMQALYDELDRTYGGRAKQMMQTFDGQLKQTTTLWQTLMTTVGGLDQTTGVWSKGGFFDTVTDQLTALNEILARHTGQAFERIAKDVERDKFFSADEAKAYGLVDEVAAFPDKSKK